MYRLYGQTGTVSCDTVASVVVLKSPLNTQLCRPRFLSSTTYPRICRPPLSSGLFQVIAAFLAVIVPNNRLMGEVGRVGGSKEIMNVTITTQYMMNTEIDRSTLQ